MTSVGQVSLLGYTSSFSSHRGGSDVQGASNTDTDIVSFLSTVDRLSPLWYREWYDASESLIILTSNPQDNNDVTDARSPELRHAAEVLQWSQELLASQQSLLEKGGSAGMSLFDCTKADYASSSCVDFGPMSVTQIGHVAKSLLPILHLLQSSPQQQQAVTVSTYLETFHSALQILRDLRPRFDSVVRDLGPVEDYARKFGVPLPEPTSSGSNTTINTSDPQSWTSGAEGNVDPGLVDAVAGTLPGETDPDADASISKSAGQGRQTSGSGSGAIQALLSLSGRPEDEISGSNRATDEQAASGSGSTGTEGLNAWWASVLSGAIEGEDKSVSRG